MPRFKIENAFLDCIGVVLAFNVGSYMIDHAMRCEIAPPDYVVGHSLISLQDGVLADVLFHHRLNYV